MRIKQGRALWAFNPARSRVSAERYVFLRVADEAKDLKKRKRYGNRPFGELVRDDASRESFEKKYLSYDRGDMYGAVGDELQRPNTLTEVELAIVTELYVDYRDPKQTEVARRLELDKRAMERHALDPLQARRLAARRHPATAVARRPTHLTVDGAQVCRASSPAPLSTPMSH